MIFFFFNCGKICGGFNNFIFNFFVDSDNVNDFFSLSHCFGALPGVSGAVKTKIMYIKMGCFILAQYFKNVCLLFILVLYNFEKLTLKREGWKKLFSTKKFIPNILLDRQFWISFARTHLTRQNVICEIRWPTKKKS